MAARDRAVGLGHRQHAHRRRRRRPGAGADRRAPVVGGDSGRVTGFAIMPLCELKRPRVDVTFRVSGLFRDAFPTQIDIIDSAVRAIAALDEPDEANPIAANVRVAAAGARGRWDGRRGGATPAPHIACSARSPAPMAPACRPDRRGRLAAIAAISPTSISTGAATPMAAAAEGEGARDAFAERLTDIDLVAQTQDNREHDILDSDDYYQFEGGLAATVQSLRGQRAAYRPYRYLAAGSAAVAAA